MGHDYLSALAASKKVKQGAHLSAIGFSMSRCHHMALRAAAVFLLVSRSALAAQSPPIHFKKLTAETTLDANGLFTTTEHVEIVASNDAAAMQVGQQEILYVPSLEDVQIDDAYTLKADGRREPVQSAIYDQARQNSPIAPTIDDVRQKTIVFPDVAAGDTIAYTVTHRAKAALLPGQYLAAHLFSSVIQIDDADFTLIAPSNLHLFLETHGVAFDKSETALGKRYHWHYRSQGPVEELKPVAVLRLDDIPHFFVSTVPTYEALGAAYWQVAAPEMRVTPAIQEEADAIASGTSDRREQARKIYEWVSRHIRYVAIELGQGAIVPHSADAVLNNGYGDCKDHTVLFVALLKARGIEAIPALMNATSAYDLSTVPTFLQLNHAITYLPEFDLYADTTAMVAPFGTLPFAEYGKPVVLATEAGGQVRATPVLAPGSATVTMTTNENLAADGHLVGTTVTSATGPSAVMLRQLGFAIQGVGPALSASKLIELRGMTGSGTFDVQSPTDFQQRYQIIGNFDLGPYPDMASGRTSFPIPGGLRTLDYSGDGFMGPLYPGKLTDKDPTPCYSGNVSETISLTAPHGMHFTRVPEDAAISTPNLSFSAHWSLDGNKITVNRTFGSRIAQPLCEGTIRKESAAALAKIVDDSNTQIAVGPN